MILSEKKINTHLKDLLTGSALAFFVKSISAAGAFLLNIVVARSLSVDQAGYFFLAQAIIIFLAATARQGLDNALVRFIASYSVNNEVGLVAGIYKYALMRTIHMLLIFSSLLMIHRCCVWIFNIFFFFLRLTSCFLFSFFSSSFFLSKSQKPTPMSL